MGKVVTRITYEWDLEEFDTETGDIIDHNHSDNFPGVPNEPNIRLVLVRDEWDGLAGDDFDWSCELKHRAWCYVDGQTLPEFFDDGARVPKRFHRHFK